jgi:hypothetical protein
MTNTPPHWQQCEGYMFDVGSWMDGLEVLCDVRVSRESGEDGVVSGGVDRNFVNMTDQFFEVGCWL